MELGQHDNGATLPVMDHLPEVSTCGLQGTLGYDERLLLLVALCAERERGRGRERERERERENKLIGISPKN